jgi:hypothetical protein
MTTLSVMAECRYEASLKIPPKFANICHKNLSIYVKQVLFCQKNYNILFVLGLKFVGYFITKNNFSRFCLKDLVCK